MTTPTKYKLLALLFFFLLFACFIVQFIFPYMPDPQLTLGFVLINNPFIVPLLVVATIVYVFQIILYPKVKDQVKVLPLIGSGLVLLLLFYAHWSQRLENLDAATLQEVMKHF